jgi:glycyl-tRNA synthetase
MDPSPLSALHSPFLLEIGTEELPAADLDSAVEQLRIRFPAFLAELRLSHGALQVFGTPRRLVVSVADLAARQPDLEQAVKGPPASRAFAPDGSPTPAAEGFARSKGLAVADLQVREVDGGSYVVAVVRQAGRPAPAVLVEALPGLLASLRFDKSMRWNSSNVAFSRPIRWLLALFGDQPVPFTFTGLTAGRTTRGLRFSNGQDTPVSSPADYFRLMESQGILLDGDLRRLTIHEQIEAVAAKAGGAVALDEGLLAEVTNLVEAPAALLGDFDPAHLDLPGEVLVSVMKKHQRYFPVEKDGRLLPCFITIANKPSSGLGDSPRQGGNCQGAETIVDGNQHVIRARFADAAFFVRDDLKRPLEDYLPRLGTLIFQTRLGTMLDKTARIEKLVEDLIPLFGLDAGETAVARRAAHLCKADLVTHMVVEMTSLQGQIGRQYALRSGEPPAVGDAIFEHYLPRFAGDATPPSRPGLAIGLADRLDTLAGLFAAGLAPTGNKDPFAQRRLALGLVQNLVAWDLDLDLEQVLQAASNHLPIPVTSNALSACLEFIVERLRNVLLEAGRRYDVVDAVLAAQGANPAGASRAVAALSAWVARPDWHTILPAYARCVRITRSFEQVFPVAPESFAGHAERDLYAALLAAEAAPRAPGSVDGFLGAFLPMIPAVSRFFDQVLVMAEDETLQRNRLGLLQRIAALAGGVADLSRLEGF